MKKEYEVLKPLTFLQNQASESSGGDRLVPRSRDFARFRSAAQGMFRFLLGLMLMTGFFVCFVEVFKFGLVQC